VGDFVTAVLGLDDVLMERPGIGPFTHQPVEQVSGMDAVLPRLHKEIEERLIVGEKREARH
jgi:hypothetical protein